MNSSGPPFVSEFLRAAGRGMRLAAASRALGIGLAVFAGVLVLAVAADAVFGFPAPMLLALDALILLAVAFGVALVIRVLTHGRFNAKRMAVFAERRLRVPDNSLINAVEFAGGLPSSRSGGGGMSAVLSDLAVRQGEAAAARLSPRAAIDGRAALRGALLGLAAAGSVLAFHALAPRVFQAVVPRLLHPRSDLAPFTLLKFDFRTEPDRVIVGHPASIIATITGPVLPETAEIVLAATPASESRVRSPLSRRADDFVFRVEKPESSLSYYVDTPQGRSGWRRLDVQPVPIIESGTVRLEFPEYTHWAPAQIALVPGTIRAIEGTRLTFFVRSNVPLKRGDLAVTAEQGSQAKPARSRVTELKPSEGGDPRTVEGSFTLDPGASGAFKLALTAADGTPSDQPLEGVLIAVPDALPQVFITEPGAVVVAPEGWKVPVIVGARDDVGVARLTLHVGVNAIDPNPIELPLENAGAPAVTAEHTIDLGALKAKDGDVIRYFASAFDNKPGTDRFADTPPQAIHVISMDAYRKMARDQTGLEEMESELDRIQARMEQLREQRESIAKQAQALAQKAKDAGGRLDKNDRDQLRDLAGQLADNAAKTHDLADAMADRADQPSVYDFEDAYKDTLREESEALNQSSDSAADLSDAMKDAAAADPLTPEQAKALEDMAKSMQENDQGEQEESDAAALTKEDMEKLRMAGAMAEQASRLSEIVQKQRDLADQLSQCDHPGELSAEDKARASRLGQEQSDLQGQTEEASTELRRLSEEAADSLPKMSKCASGLCDKISDMGVSEDQSLAAKSAGSGQGEKAHAAAEDAAKKLESLQSECNSMGEPSDDIDGCLGLSKPQLGQSMKQLAARRPGTRPGGKPGSAKGQKPGSKPGGEGSGSSGTQGKFTLMGPHMNQQDRVRRARMGSNLDGRGLIPGEPGLDPLGMERLNPDSASSGRGRGGALQGVPARYRDEVEYYFRRLSEDAAPKGNRP